MTLSNPGVSGWLLLAWCIFTSCALAARIVAQDKDTGIVWLHSAIVAASWTFLLWMMVTP